MQAGNEPAYLSDVLAFAAKGAAVFPVRNKKPLIDEGFKKASTDTGLITGWWRMYNHPDYAWAMPEGVMAVDIDDPAAFTTTGLTLPETAHQSTPRGHHYFYDIPEGVRVEQGSHVAPGMDTRVGGKGYVVLYEPGSVRMPRVQMPSWVTTLGNNGHTNGDIPAKKQLGPQWTTRDQILRALGNIASLGFGMDAQGYAGMLAGWRAQGTIVAADPSRPWTDEDLLQIAGEAAEWDTRAAAEIAQAGTFSASVTGTSATPKLPIDIATITGLHIMSEIDRTPVPPLILDRWAPDGASILYGTGGVGKGRLAAQEIAYYTRQDRDHRVLIVDYEDHEQEWRNRLEDCGGRLDQCHWVGPHGRGWSGPRGTILEHADTLRAAAEFYSDSLLVIDSAMMAVPGLDVGDPAAPQRWNEALQRIGLPSLTLAHVTKADDDPRYPFGSIFWHNLARVTWSISDSTGKLTLRSRKHNNYADSSYSWRYVLEPVESYEEGTNVRFLVSSGFWSLTPANESLTDRIIEMVEAQPGVSTTDLANVLGSTTSIVRVLLNKKKDRFERSGQGWKLVDGDAPEA